MRSAASLGDRLMIRGPIRARDLRPTTRSSAVRRRFDMAAARPPITPKPTAPDRHDEDNLRSMTRANPEMAESMLGPTGR